jgi:serine/threonine-protein kinase 24/25/MST4
VSLFVSFPPFCHLLSLCVSLKYLLCCISGFFHVCYYGPFHTQTQARNKTHINTRVYTHIHTSTNNYLDIMAAVATGNTTIDELLMKWQAAYKLPDTHLEYLRLELDDAQERYGNRADPNDLLEQYATIETWAKTTPYHIEERIGKGAFGQVYRARDIKKDVVIAVKVIDLEDTKDDIASIHTEILNLRDGRTCSQLTSYYGCATFGTKIWIAMEYADGGSVLNVVQKQKHGLEEKYIAVIVKEVIAGLCFLNAEHKIHRDIKAANILLTKDGRVKLADFGASRQLTDTMTRCSTFVGSPYWMAPEVMTQNSYDGQADIWSLGITVIEMALGKPPLKEHHPLKAVSLIPLQPAPKLESKDGEFSQAMRNFVSVCLVKNPQHRANLDLLKQHPFIRGACDKKILRELFDDED